MESLGRWPDAPPLATARLVLEPLRVDHAEEMTGLLGDVALHEFIGGRPATLAELRGRYERQVTGVSPDGTERWHNWVVRRRDDAMPIGTVQATVTAPDTGIVAEVAWVVGTAYQGRGYAREAASVMVAWLREQGAEAVIAHVHPGHTASVGVARAVGLAATATVVDGEVRYSS